MIKPTHDQDSRWCQISHGGGAKLPPVQNYWPTWIPYRVWPMHMLEKWLLCHKAYWLQTYAYCHQDYWEHRIMSSKMDFSCSGKFTKSPNMTDIFLSFAHPFPLLTLISGREDWLMGCIKRATLSPNLQLSLGIRNSAQIRTEVRAGYLWPWLFPWPVT